jgi:hypothetical protein
MASEDWSEGDERDARAIADDATSEMPGASTNPALREMATQTVYDAIRTAVLAERARWRAVAQAAGRVERVIDYRLYKHSAPAAEAMLAMRTALAALPPAGKGRP